MKLITFENKVATKTSSADRKNCVTDDDINDIKEAINENANINIYSSDEIKIGKWGDKDLFRKKIEYNENELTRSNQTISLDISSLGAEDVFVDFAHSYFLDSFEENNETINLHNAITRPDFRTSRLSDILNSSLVLLYNDQFEIRFFVGANYTFTKLILVLEYTKGE